MPLSPMREDEIALRRQPSEQLLFVPLHVAGTDRVEATRIEN
jgi:hypothetical protein